MKGHLLICDNTPELGGILSRRFMNMGILAECCHNSPSQIEKALTDSDISEILIFSFSIDEELINFIKNNRECGRKVFVGLFAQPSSVNIDLKNAGALCCFDMPCSFNDICRNVMLNINSDGSVLAQLEVLMEEYGFPRKLKGFFYLAKAAEIALSEPERLWGGMIGIYEEIAQHYAAKASSVERAIRNLAAHACKNGASARITEYRITVQMNNTELICALCDLFKRL